MYRWWKQPKDKPAEMYWQIEIGADILDLLWDVAENRAVPPTGREKLKTRLMFAREFAAPLVHLEWGEVEREARRQGTTVSDILFDRMGRR